MTESTTNELLARAEARLPGGVNSSVRRDAPPIFFCKGNGAWLWDVEGRRYVDYLLGQGPAFFGHAHPKILEAVDRAARGGILFGSRTPLEVEAAERFCETMGWVDMVRFGSTATEMVQASLRLARAATGRRLFVRFEGHYHGWLDNVLIRAEDGVARPVSAGQVKEHLQDCILLPWNDQEALTRVLQDRGDEIAAVLMEPIMINAGVIEPLPGYLDAVRQACESAGALLIFDETISGFRIALGGAVERYGVRPHLAIYGKAMGGGYPVAALAGSRSLMELIDVGGVNHSGTFNGNALAMAATVAALQVLSPQHYADLGTVGRTLMNGLREVADAHGLELTLQGLPMAFHARIGDRQAVVQYRDLSRADTLAYGRFVERMVEQGVWLAKRGIWYLSIAHGSAELQATLEAMDAALERFAVGGSEQGR